MSLSGHELTEYLIVWYDKITKPTKDQAKRELREDYNTRLPISKCFRRLEDAVQFTDNTKFK